MSTARLFPDPKIDMSNWADPSDITFHKHGGNANSIKANPSPEKKEIVREKIIKLLQLHGKLDIHQFEILLGKSANKFSGRLTALKVAKIVVDGEDGKWRLA